MNYNIQTTTVFERQAKRFAKKYPSFKSDLMVVLEEIRLNPMQGKLIGSNCYKVRVSIKSKQKGKSAGARLITHLAIENETVYLLSIYDKSDQETISDKEIMELLSSIP